MFTLTVFVNEQPVEVGKHSTVLDAVTKFNSNLPAALESGEAYVTDGVGRRIDVRTRVDTGTIVRVVGSARKKLASD